LKVKDPCPFGYGTNCGGGKPLTAATKAQVAGILEGILGNLQSHKALVESHVSVHRSGELVDNSALQALQGLIGEVRSKKTSAADALQNLLARSQDPSVACMYFGACDAGSHPITPETKAEVAGILEGVLKNLSSHN